MSANISNNLNHIPFGIVGSHRDYYEDIDSFISSIKEPLDYHTILTIGKIGINYPEKVKHLVLKFEKYLDNKDFKIKLATLCSISLISIFHPKLTEKLIPKLIRMLDDEDWKIKKHVLDVLGNLGLSNAELLSPHIQKIIEFLNDKNQIVINSAAQALAKIASNPNFKDNFNFDLIKILQENINNKIIFSEVLLSISEINPKILEDHQDMLFEYLDDKNLLVKVNILKTISNLENVKLDKKRADKITNGLINDSLEVRKYTTHTIWKIARNNASYFKPAVSKLIRNLDTDDTDAKTYTLYALGELCFLAPKEMEWILPSLIKYLKNKDPNIKKATLYLLHNISLYNPKIIAKEIDKIIPLLDDESKLVTKYALRILGNVGKHNKEPISKHTQKIKKMLNNDDLKHEATITLIKCNIIDSDVVLTILDALNDIKSNMKFLKRVIESYPTKIPPDFYTEIKKRRNYDNDAYVDELLKLIWAKNREFKHKTKKTEKPKMKIEKIRKSEEPSIIVALKSECVEVELENGKKVYIIQKDKCKETRLSKELLDIIEKEEDFETQLLSHELLVKSLVETILIEENRQRNKK